MRILLCDHFPGLLPEYIPSYESMFMRLFDALGVGMKYEVYNTIDGELPPLDGNGEIHLITGSNQGAYDDAPWIKALLEWIVSANALGMKIVGICFGHQAIAQALGGEVRRATAGWGTGIRESSVMGEGLRYFPSGVMRLMYNHHDQVTRLPEGAVRLATSEFCPNEAFSVGDNILSFQGHPEYVVSYAVHLLMNFAQDEPLPVRTAALRSLGLHIHDGSTVARWIVDRLGFGSERSGF